jgi:hypothetical protein
MLSCGADEPKWRLLRLGLRRVVSSVAGLPCGHDESADELAEIRGR